MIDLIHIGDYKNASSFLQTNVFTEENKIIWIDNPKQFPSLARLIQLVIYTDIRFVNKYKFKIINEIKKIKKQYNSSYKFVISREALSGNFINGDNRENILNKIKFIFGSVKVLLIVRNPCTLIRSLYSEYIKFGNYLSFNQFQNLLESNNNYKKKISYKKWIQSIKKNFDYFKVYTLSNITHFKNEVIYDLFKFMNHKHPFVESKNANLNKSLSIINIQCMRIYNFLFSLDKPTHKNFLIEKLILYFCNRKIIKKIILFYFINRPHFATLNSTKENILIHIRFFCRVVIIRILSNLNLSYFDKYFFKNSYNIQILIKNNFNFYNSLSSNFLNEK